VVVDEIGRMMRRDDIRGRMMEVELDREASGEKAATMMEWLTEECKNS
jgi:hypothetical protein